MIKNFKSFLDEYNTKRSVSDAEYTIIYDYLKEVYSSGIFSENIIKDILSKLDGEFDIGDIDKYMSSNSSYKLSTLSMKNNHSYDDGYHFTLHGYEDSHVVRSYKKLIEGSIPVKYYFLELNSYDGEKIDIKHVERYIESILNRNSITTSNVTVEKKSFGYITSISISDNNFKIKDPFTDEICIEYIKSNNKNASGLAKYLSDKSLYNLLDSNPELVNIVDTDSRLKYTKYNKRKTNPKRSKMESENTMYIFIAKDTFTETPDGNYKKDIEIERMVPIDPYNKGDLAAINMMKVRARINMADVYMIWLPKDIDQDELDNINSNDMLYFRNALKDKMEKI